MCAGRLQALSLKRAHARLDVEQEAPVEKERRVRCETHTNVDVKHVVALTIIPIVLGIGILEDHWVEGTMIAGSGALLLLLIVLAVTKSSFRSQRLKKG